MAHIFDSHAHYDDPRFDETRETLLSSLPKAGVCGIITCGCDKVSSLKAIELAEKFDFVYAAIGIHPGNISDTADLNEIEKLCSHKKCVAIGEVGLDYYWEKENRETQIEFFEKQILLAKKLNLPVIVHDRDAHSDTLSILQKYKPKGVVHCFSGSLEMAREIINIGMHIGVGGVITFKNAKRLPEVVSVIPDDRLLVETDCPYLAPEPHRGKLCNSGMIIHTAQKIAEIRNTSLEKILELTEINSKALFGIQ